MPIITPGLRIEKPPCPRPTVMDAPNLRRGRASSPVVKKSFVLPGDALSGRQSVAFWQGSPPNIFL